MDVFLEKVEKLRQNNKTLEEEITNLDNAIGKNEDVSMLVQTIQKVSDESNKLLLDMRKENEEVELDGKNGSDADRRIRESVHSQLASKFWKLVSMYRKTNRDLVEHKEESIHQQQYRNILLIEKSLLELQNLFNQMDLFLHLQENKISRIDKYLEQAELYTSSASKDLIRAGQTQKGLCRQRVFSIVTVVMGGVVFLGWSLGWMWGK